MASLFYDYEYILLSVQRNFTLTGLKKVVADLDKEQTWSRQIYVRRPRIRTFRIQKLIFLN